MRFFESTILKIGYGALQLTTQAPKRCFRLQNGLFWPFLGQKCGFCCDDGSEKLKALLQNLAKHFFFDSSTLKIGYGALQLPNQAPKTLFRAKKGIFWPFWGKKAVFW